MKQASALSPTVGNNMGRADLVRPSPVFMGASGRFDTSAQQEICGRWCRKVAQTQPETP